MKLTLHIWRQKSAGEPGQMVPYSVEANEHMSFLEMLDVLNEELDRRRVKSPSPSTTTAAKESADRADS